MMRDKKGITALHYAAVVRDISAAEQLIKAMENDHAETNTLSGYYGPINHSVLDFIERRKAAPKGVIKRGQVAVEQ